jgi:L-lactate dehydrogenase complex protein LldG
VSARAEILARIRAGLAGASGAGGRGPVEPSGPSPGDPTGLDTPFERTARFTRLLEAVGGRVEHVRDEAEAARALAAIAARHGARTLALSDDPRIERIARAAGAGLELFASPIERERLFAADLGFSGAQWGIAETGSLVLDSAAERHRLVSLVPPVHVALLEAAAILPTLGATLAATLAAARGPTQERPLAGRSLTIVTGPSRTADIELTLVVGVHGPRELHVLLLDPSPGTSA